MRYCKRAAIRRGNASPPLRMQGNAKPPLPAPSPAPTQHPFTPSHPVHVARLITPYNISHKELHLLALRHCGTNTETPIQTDRGGGGLPALSNFSYNSSPHLKIFSANGPPPPLATQPARTSSAPCPLCAWPVSHTLLDAPTQAGYIRVGLLEKRT